MAPIKIVHLAVAALAVSCAAACTEQKAAKNSSPAPGTQAPASSAPPTSGAGALGKSFASLEELAAWVQQQTGSCADAKRSTIDYFSSYVGADTAKLYQPYMAGWARCGQLSQTTSGPNVTMILFKPGQMTAFQQTWKQAIQSGKVADNPDFTFGNGFALSGGSGDEELGEKLGLQYLRCKPLDELNANKMPADVDGCVFSNVPGD